MSVNVHCVLCKCMGEGGMYTCRKGGRGAIE